MFDDATRDRLLAHIGLDRPPPADLAGLAAVQRAWLDVVPFEALHAQLGEYAPIDPARLVDRIVAGGRGGYCFEVNTVLAMLLESLGFAVTRHEAIVGARDAFANGVPTNHLALVVATPEGPHIAEVGLGEGPVEPLPLAEGTYTRGAFPFEVAREGDGWWVGLVGNPSTPGFRFADTAVGLEAFAPHHERLATSPESGFVRTLVIQRAEPDRVVTLRARTLTIGSERRVLADAADLEATLRGVFRIDTDALGPDRLARLWAQACEQHEAFVARD